MPGPQDPTAPALLEALLSEPDVRSRYETLVPADPPSALRAVRGLDLGRSRIVRTLFALRGLPPEALRLEGFQALQFVILANREDELVLGGIGQPWKLRGELLSFAAADFPAFDEPGYAKMAWNFHARAVEGQQTALSTETRVRCTDATSRRRFRRYWRLIGPFSGLIRRIMLRRIRRDLLEPSAKG